MRCARWLAVLLAAGIAAGARGQALAPDVSELVAAERRAADKSLSTREREASADRATELRRGLIERAGADEGRLAGWLIDQAAALLARLGRDGADSEVLFGIPLTMQRETVGKSAAEAADLLTRAERRAESGEPGAGQGDDLRGSGGQQDRTVRIPFFRARAEILLAALTEGVERMRHAESARVAIERLALANAGPEAVRRVNLGTALLLRHSPAEPVDAQTAMDECTWVVRTASEHAGVIAPITQAEAWLAIVHAGVASGKADEALAALTSAESKAPFVEEGRPDPLLAVLATDGAARALFERGVATRTPGLLARAAGQEDRLLARTDLGLRPESLKPLVLEKLGLLAASAPDGLALPPAIRLARGIAQARDPARRDEALATFAAVADEPEAGSHGTDALWEMAVVLTQPPRGTPEDRVRAAAALTRLARAYTEHPRAEEAVAAALAYARAAAAESPTAEGRSAARRAYAEALAVATTAFGTMPDIDLFRYERARLLADPPGGASPGDEDLQTAISLLEVVAPKSPVSSDANRLCERAHVQVLEGLWNQAEVLRAKGSGGAVALRRFAAEHLEPAAKRAERWARARSSPSLPRFRLDLADAMVEAGSGEGRDIYDGLLPKAAALPGGEARVRLGLARSLVVAGDTAAAFPQLRQVASSLDAPSTDGAARPELFWHAWTLMLELLAAENQDGSRAGAIRAHIKRLRTIDGGLGGEPWRSRIEGVLAGLG